MKKVIGLFLILISSLLLINLTSCEKEETGGGSSVDCNCGRVTAFDSDAAGYYARIKNYCTNNSKWFKISYSDWYYGKIGDKGCSSSSWKSTSIDSVDITTTGDGNDKEPTGEYKKH